MLSTAVIKPTPEQEAAVEAFVAKEDLKLLAVAGSGKTTTLKLMAEARPRGRFLYLVFNRALREEAERKRSFSPPGTSTPVNADGEARAGKIRRRSTARILRILPYRLNRIFTPITSALSFREKRGCGGAIIPRFLNRGYMDSPTCSEGAHSIVGSGYAIICMCPRSALHAIRITTDTFFMAQCGKS